MIRSVRTSSRRKKKKAMRSRAWLNDVEVTRDCFYADDRAGVVRLFVRGQNGGISVDPLRHEPVKVERHGRVRIGRAAVKA